MKLPKSSRGGGKLVFFFSVVLSAFLLGAVDLPWVYDLSGRTIVEVTDKTSLNYSGSMITMSGFWRYLSNSAHIHTLDWCGITIIMY